MGKWHPVRAFPVAGETIEPTKYNAGVQVAKTARVQRAKHLLDCTELTMTEVTMRAGFRSLRRFNAVFIEVYRRSPTQVRRFGRANGRGPRVGNPQTGESGQLLPPNLPPDDNEAVQSL